MPSVWNLTTYLTKVAMINWESDDDDDDDDNNDNDSATFWFAVKLKLVKSSHGIVLPSLLDKWIYFPESMMELFSR